MQSEPTFGSYNQIETLIVESDCRLASEVLAFRLDVVTSNAVETHSCFRSLNLDTFFFFWRKKMFNILKKNFKRFFELNLVKPEHTVSLSDT